MSLISEHLWISEYIRMDWYIFHRWGEFIKHPLEAVSVGDIVDVK